MENVISRNRNLANLVVLVAVVIAEILGLAFQVKRKTDSGSITLMRVWAVGMVSPFEKGIVHGQDWAHDTWHDYIEIRKLKAENQQLRDDMARMRLEQVRLIEDANQAHRLQTLLGFKEQYISKTLPAQVISTTGSEFSRGVYIDKGANDGVKQDMPVITPDGVIGKILRVYPSTSLVLEINDPTSGIGVILEQSRLQGILKGNANGELLVNYIMADEKVQPGERVLTSGGDRVFPKGMPVGTVARVGPGQDTFLGIHVKPAAQFSRAEEVLVVTKIDERTPTYTDASSPVRAIDILAGRLPSVPPPAAVNQSKQETATAGVNKPAATNGSGTNTAATRAVAKPKAQESATQTASTTPSPTPKPKRSETQTATSTAAPPTGTTAAAVTTNPAPKKPQTATSTPAPKKTTPSPELNAGPAKTNPPTTTVVTPERSVKVITDMPDSKPTTTEAPR